MSQPVISSDEDSPASIGKRKLVRMTDSELVAQSGGNLKREPLAKSKTYLFDSHSLKEKLGEYNCVGNNFWFADLLFKRGST